MDQLTCCVCGTVHDRGAEEIGTFGPEESEKRYPVCSMCMESGRHEAWRKSSIDEISASPHRLISCGNLADDIRELHAFLKHDSRIEDGACPNGCARMLAMDSHNAECPVCHFGFFHNTGIADLNL